MPLIITSESHLDHGMTAGDLQLIVEMFKNENSFFIRTIHTSEFGLVVARELRCALYGPIMGDSSIVEPTWKPMKVQRPGRSYTSRCINASTRPTRLLTIIAGPHNQYPCMLYTAFGGPLAPKEPGDPTMKDEDRAASEKFWSEHALAIG